MSFLMRPMVMLAAVALASDYAEAKIVCSSGGYQRVQGREIATPYCQDEYFAAVARERGFKVSAAEIRQSYTLKEEVCRYIGADIRISDQCPTGSRRGRY